MNIPKTTITVIFDDRLVECRPLVHRRAAAGSAALYAGLSLAEWDGAESITRFALARRLSAMACAR